MTINIPAQKIDADDHFDLVLESPCPDCNGGLKVEKIRKTGVPCPTCKGHHVIPTILGQHILAFCVRNAKRWKNGEFKHLSYGPNNPT